MPADAIRAITCAWLTCVKNHRILYNSVRKPTNMTAAPKKLLKGKIALVAGATRGAGRGIAIALGEAGATV
jgi:hypothetical protein